MILDLNTIDRKLLEKQRIFLWDLLEGIHPAAAHPDPSMSENVEGLLSLTDAIADAMDGREKSCQ